MEHSGNRWPPDDAIATVIGPRQSRPVGPPRPPTPEERAWVLAMANRQTRVPKGVFRYRSMADANEDWERWCAELVAATVSPSRQG